ncbi:hypothetical protein [Polycladidibacter hongkongensis]|uniref:hypothetical protein n=1 Tax=Polycladidibacter hongkongensis TaxID=1647556 RepID=UPI00082DB7F6|nr:hypothetical protein [Pseudovibrio hongkongensis]
MNIKQCVLALASLAVVAGCQTQTQGVGRIQSASGVAVQSVNFTFNEEAFSDGAQVTASLPSGEMFTGKMVIGKKETEKFGESFDINFDDDDDDDISTFNSSTSTTYSSTATGVLFSSTRTMQCKITLSSPSMGFSEGGVGQCKLSTGEILPVQF